MNLQDDPVWTYLDAQHKYILEQLRKVFLTAITAIQSKLFNLRSIVGLELSDAQRNKPS